MSPSIPEKYRDLFTKRAFASLGTLMPDGRPQVTPVWIDFDGEHVIFNSAKGRQKDRNVRRDPRVSLALIDPENPYRYVEIRGTVVEITEDGASAHIDKMAKKYLEFQGNPETLKLCHLEISHLQPVLARLRQRQSDAGASARRSRY
jgi:PPOX class probable F420-dependent enzyme